MAEKSRPQKSWALAGKAGREKSWSSDLESFDFKEHKDKYIKVRLVTQSLTEKLHWIYLDVKNAVKHAQGDTPNYKQAPSFPVVCPDFDPYKEEGTPNKCPVCLHFSSYARPSLSYYCWAYVCIPSKKGGSDRWLEDPVVLKLGTGIVIGIQNTIALRGGVDPADPIEGYYVNIMAKKEPKGPNDAYVVQAGEAMKLTKAQRAAVKELPDLFEMYKPTAPATIKASLSQKGYYELLEEEGRDSEEDDEDDDGESVGKKKSKKAAGKKKSSKYDDSDDEDDADDDEEDEEDDDDNEEEDERSSKKNSKKKSSRYADDEDSDDDENEDDADEEEIRPSKKNNKKSSKPEKKSSKKSKYVDEDDSDDDSDDEDGEDDIPAPKNSSIAKKKLKDSGKKKKSRRDIDEDDE